MIYKDFLRNHVVIPGHEGALEKFLKQDYEKIGTGTINTQLPG